MRMNAHTLLLTYGMGATPGPSQTTRMACSKDSNACEPAHRASTMPTAAAKPRP